MLRTIQFLIVFMLGVPAAHAVEIVGTGDINCSVVVINQANVDQETQINFDGDECNVDPQLDVKFVWLDSNQVSYLYSNIEKNNLPGIFGDRPKLLNNLIGDAILDVYNKFSVRMLEENNDTYINTKLSGHRNNQYTTIDIGYSPSTHEEGANYSKLLPIHYPIIWLDNEFSSSFSNNLFPDSYNYSYSNSHRYNSNRALLRAISRGVEKNWAQLSSDLSGCMTAYRFVGRNEFDQYWDQVEILADKKDDIESSWNIDINPEYFDMLDNVSYRFIDEHIPQQWPNDFLVLKGNIINSEIDHCNSEDSGGILLLAFPRELFVQYAVIKPITKNVTLNSAAYRIDSSSQIRLSPEFKDDLKREELGAINLNREKGESLIIPLKMELRYSENFISSLMNQLGTEIQNIFDTNPDRAVDFRRCYVTEIDENGIAIEDENGNIASRCKKLSTLKLSDFPNGNADPIKINEVYVFGEVRELAEIGIDGKNIEIRKAPEMALYTESGIEAGSCPFLYYEMSDGNLIKAGRILVGASSIDQIRRENYTIPSGAVKLIIAELEPEISYLRKIDFVGENIASKDVAQNATLENIILKPRDSIVFEIPAGANSFNVEGYYELLSRSN